MSSGIYYIDALLAPSAWQWNTSTLTYGFMTTAPGYAYADPAEASSFKALNSTQRSGVHRAVQEFEAVCNIDLQYVSNGNGATIRFGTSAQPADQAAYAYYPSTFYEEGGDVWFNNISGADAYQQSAGSYGFMVSLHELGHAVGLKHSFERETGAQTILTGVKDTRRYTVMAYDAHPTASVEPSTLLLYDIAALQYLYGANTSTRVGNDTYTWARDAQFVSCIWDADGTDTISAATQTRAVTIDLRAGYFSSIGRYGSGSARDNLSIAYGAVIENATGGSGNDRLIGNSSSNRLDGGAGSDTAVFRSNKAAYTISKSGGQVIVTGGSDGTDTLIGMEYMQFADQTVTINRAPVATASTYTPAHGILSVDLDDLFNVSDSDLDPIAQYWFYDGTAGNGRLVLNGTPLAEAQVLTPINAADLANLTYTTSATGSDLLWVQAFDGYEWGPWKSFTVNAMANAAPMITVLNRPLVHGETSIAVDDLFNVSDSDLDPITQYWFYDGTAGNGRLVLNGTPLAEAQVLAPINAADLANLTFETSASGPNLLWVQAHDGYAWGPWKSFTVNAMPNAAPTITELPTRHPAHGETSLAMADIFQASDADGDPVVQYRLYDGTPGANGNFVINGMPWLANQNFIVSDLSTVDFATSSGSDVIWVQGYDGYGWGAWSRLTIEAMPNSTAVLAPLDSVYTPARGTISINIETRFAFNDPDAGDTAARYRFYDGTPGAGGNFVVNGTAWLANQNFVVDPVELATVDFAPAGTGSDVVWLQVHDGYGWGAWTKFTVNAPQNNVPVVTTFSQSAQVNTVLTANSLFSAPIMDADGDAVGKYGFWDSTSGGGSFRVAGAPQPAAVAVEVMAGQLATLDFLTGAGAGTDRLWVRAHDGFAWSDWKALNITTLAPA